MVEGSVLIKKIKVPAVSNIPLHKPLQADKRVNLYFNYFTGKELRCTFKAAICNFSGDPTKIHIEMEVIDLSFIESKSKNLYMFYVRYFYAPRFNILFFHLLLSVLYTIFKQLKI